MLKTLGEPRVDFRKVDYENIIYQKGRDVLFEKALLCPCKGKSSSQQSDCKNCGGTGWVFINPTETRMVVQGISIVSDIKPWSEESRGTINISCSDSEQLSFMDKITLVDAKAIHTEVLFFKRSSQGQFFAYTAYSVQSILYAGLLISSQQAFQKLVRNELSIAPNKNALILTPANFNFIVPSGMTEFSITVRYYHAPTFHVIEMRREGMMSFKFAGGVETNQDLPTSALGRRSHYVLNAPDLYGERLFDNSI